MNKFIVFLVVVCFPLLGHCNINPQYAEKLCQAIYKAEGGEKTKYPYGIVSIKIKSKDHAKRICMNTIKNNYKRFKKKGMKGDYIDYLAKIYCPIGCENDNGTNKFWAKNVKKFMGERGGQ